MRFAVLHKLVSYLLILSAILALLLSGELSPIVVILVFPAVVVSWFVEPRSASRWGVRIWTVATIGFFLYTLLDVIVADAPALVGGVQFLLFLVVNKLFNRRQSRDYLQLYVLSFLTLVAAAALNTDLSFALCFVLYVICATWSLTLLHLRREMEENYLLRHTEPLAVAKRVEVERVLHSKRIVGGEFLFATSLLSLSIFVASSVLFFLFPRVGFGLLFGKSRSGVSMAGFSERIELGRFGRIKDNPAVVLRVEIPGMKPRPRLSWHWRGIAFDTYDGKTWRKRRAGWKQLRRGRYSREFLTGGLFDRSKAIRAQVYQEPISRSNVIFAPGNLLSIQLPQKRTFTRADPRYVRRDVLGDLSLDGDPSISVSYALYFNLDEPKPEDLRKIDLEALPPKYDRYLQLPDLHGDVVKLAKKITQGKQSLYDSVVAVERHLRKNYRYTLDLKRDDKRPPLEDFLFNQKAGHCEYFSTAMVILLRTLEIPARNVNGFLGGEWNSYGRYYTIRQGDAHSWVEVYFPGAGWVSFDPTPPDGRNRRIETGILASISAFIDSIRLKWYKYVIEYDLGKQVGFFRGIGRWFRRLFSSAGLRELGTNLRDFFSSAWGILTAMLILVLIVLLIRRRRKRAGPNRRERRRRRDISELYVKLLEIARRAGYEKPSSQTPLSFARWLAEKGAPFAEVVVKFTRRYNEVRFGGRSISAAELRDLKQLVRTMDTRPQSAPG